MKIINKDIAILEDDTHISKWVEQEGRLDHDQNMLPLILPFIPVGGIVIDAGAYIDDHTIAYARKVGASGSVYAFEPNEKAYDCLVYNLNDLQNTIPANCGLGETDGYSGMYFAPGNIGMTYLSGNGDTPIMTIDGLKLSRLDFIKIDVEGYELSVLKGAKKYIKKYRPVMLIELNDDTFKRSGIRRGEIFKFLDKFGYRYENIYKDQGINETKMDLLCQPN